MNRAGLVPLLSLAVATMLACSSSTTKFTDNDPRSDAGPDASKGGSAGSTTGNGGSTAGSGGSTAGSGGSPPGSGGSTAGGAGTAQGGSAGSAAGGTAGGDGSAGSAGALACPVAMGPTLSLVDGFCIDKTEVSNRHYDAFLKSKNDDTSGQIAVCASNTSYVPTDYWPVAPNEIDMPVVMIDWCDAYAYCKWAGKRLCGKIGGGSNAIGDYAAADKSQWFRVCSNAGTSRFPYGNSYGSQTCNGFDGPNGCYSSPAVADGDCTLAPVGTYLACQGTGKYAGIFDLSGNVLEWEDSCTKDPDGGADLCRLRGGAIYAQSVSDMACDTDSIDERFHTAPGLGFRCCYP